MKYKFIFQFQEFQNNSNVYVLKWQTFFNFEKSKSVIQSTNFMNFEKSKFENTLKIKVFRSKTFVMQKLSLDVVFSEKQPKSRQEPELFS